MSTATVRADVYTRVTNRIVADLEAGTPTWLKPWSAEHLAGKITRPLRGNAVPYKGVNVFMLWAEATARGFVCPIWMTYRQARELGGQVRKGETGSLVVYADKIVRTETTAQGEEAERAIPFLKGYSVFNCEQIDGLPDRFQATAPRLDPAARIARAEQFLTASRADTRHGGDRAYYAIHPDYVQMPPFEAFRDAVSYYATLAHELTHWTRHPSRLDRDFGRKRYGDEGYAREELVAELGAAFLCADLDLTPEPRPDHAAYIASWLDALRNDRRFIFTAASHAQRAADYLHGLYRPGAADAEEGRAAA
jgi:antirestriction protein ArdC